MGWVRAFIILIMLSVSFAAVISGDAGADFASQTAESKCKEGNVQAVYACIGNVVRVVSTIPGAGSTFYRPDGGVVSCPVVTPSQMGAECVHMLMPNFCPSESVCGNVTAPEVFPGYTDSPEQRGDEDYYVNESAAVSAEDGSEELVPPQPPKQQTQNPGSEVAKAATESEVPLPAPSNFEFSLDALSIVLFLLGVISVAVLFMMFKSSISEDPL